MGSGEAYTIDLLLDPALRGDFDHKEANVLLQVSCKEQHEYSQLINVMWGCSLGH